MKDKTTTLISTAAVLDAAGTFAQPGCVAVQAGRLLYAGRPDLAPAADRRIQLPNHLVLPQLINSHAHLELTAVGPQPYTGDFVSWIRLLREHWPGEGDPWARRPDERWFADAASAGARQSLACAVQAVGDITRSPLVAQAARRQGLAGVWFIELFGLGPPWDQPALDLIPTLADGLQPHAPYSAGPNLFAAAAGAARPVATHLAETTDELAFVAQATGPYRDLLARLGKWDEAHTTTYRRGLTPVQWMQPNLERTRWLVAHCNYVTDADIAILARTGTSVAYCPVASEYFGHANHRYREMLAAGVNVCLGTDSIVCQPAHEPQPLGIWPQMRRLFQRDGTDPMTLLRMATVNGARALGLPEATATLRPGAPARLATVQLQRPSATPLADALTSNAPLEPITF